MPILQQTTLAATGCNPILLYALYGQIYLEERVIDNVFCFWLFWLFSIVVGSHVQEQSYL